MPTRTTCRHPHPSQSTPRVAPANGVRTSSRGRPLRPAVREWWLSHSSSTPPMLRTVPSSRASFQQSVTIPTVPPTSLPLVKKTPRAPAIPTVPSESRCAPIPASDLVQPDYCASSIPLENAEDTASSTLVHRRGENYPLCPGRLNLRSSVRAICNSKKELSVAKHVTANSGGRVVCQFCEPFDSSNHCLCRLCGRGMTNSPTDMVCSTSNRSPIKPRLLHGMIQFAHKQQSCCQSRKRPRDAFETDRGQLNELGRVKRRRYDERYDRGDTNQSSNNYRVNCFCAA